MSDPYSSMLRFAPDVAGPWSRWPDPTMGGTVTGGGKRSSARPRRPAAVDPTDPVSIVTALKRYVDDLRRASSAAECITVTSGEVLHGIGLGQYTGLTGDSRRPVEKLCLSTLLVLGFEAGTRGKHPITRQINRVFRLPPTPTMAAASASQSSAVSAMTQPASTEPARLYNTRPTRTDRTQRRMAAEKRATSGNKPT